ncbi:MAG TPA: M56 family metallopeptidase [Pyrinomonadaceae bacterium]|nr:M56 family metallopeptidase [Pyrinomonadaceae bacterium]
MNWENIAESKIVTDLGLTLFHSIWEIAIISLVLFIALALSRKSSSRFRYTVSLAALLFTFLFPVFTFVSISQTADISLDTLGFPDSNEVLLDGNYRSGDDLPRTMANSDHASAENRTASFSLSMQQAVPSIFPAAVGLWLLGVAFFSIRILGGFWQVRRYKTFGVSQPDDIWIDRFAELSSRLQIRNKVELLCSNIVATPIAVGLFKPLIIVPASVFLQIPPRELETIIAHELIHIRRYDPFVNLIQNAIETALFYHPGVWWISAKVRSEREFAADAAVLSIFENSSVTYANALASLEEIRHLAKHTTPSIVTAANGGNLMQRIKRILQKNTEKAGASSAWPAGLALVLISAVITASFSFSSSPLVNAQSKTSDRKLAIGFVSIPPVDRSDNPPKDSFATAQILIDKLRSHKVPAIGFVQGSMISDGEKLFPVRAEIVKMWRDAGFEIGVGGYKHIRFFDTPFDEYTANVEKNLDAIKPVIAEKNITPKYFSYPYLNTGRSDDNHIRFEKWLQDRGLTSVKYTVDNNEWMYSHAYDLARNDNDIDLMKEIRSAFLDYMGKMFDHYESYSKQMFGRDIAQTMVLTPSRLVADSADDLFGMIEKRGYAFVPMNVAQADEAYKTPESFADEAGISWFERWSISQGKPLLDEPEVDQSVQSAWKAKNTKN